MDFLCKWLMNHPSVMISLVYEDEKFSLGKRLYVYMTIDDHRIAKVINLEYEKDFIEIIFNEMYNELISKGGSI